MEATLFDFNAVRFTPTHRHYYCYIAAAIIMKQTGARA